MLLFPHLRTVNYKRNLSKYLIRMQSNEETPQLAAETEPRTVITEGKATISTGGKVFLNPVQEFNRDLSISALNAFAQIFAKEKDSGKIKENSAINIQEDYPFIKGEKCDKGLTILEALSATGLRSIRYAKEVAGVHSILANDINYNAVEDIKKNVLANNVAELVSASMNDAVMLMHQHKRQQFDVIDLDPYGCPSIFLDSALQAIKDGGLLLVTATDMAVLAGNSPETCYSKYGAVSLRMKSCHEMSLRILLQAIESHANRYGRFIIPQLSISADFYVRVFVRVYTGPFKCKYTLSKLSLVYHCTGCDSFVLQPLGTVKINHKNGQPKFGLPTNPLAETVCEHCKHPYHVGGPIWNAPIHNPEFVKQILLHSSSELQTYKRIEGVLSVVLEELNDAPLYYALEKLTGTLHVETPPMMTMRSAILNAGYLVSYTHANKTSIKTNAPGKVIWDIMRTWTKSHPISKKWLDDDKVTKNIMEQEISGEHKFDIHPDANPESRRLGFKRFQENPTAFWGPGCRSTAMIKDDNAIKRKENQGKRKRRPSKPTNSSDYSSTVDNIRKEMKTSE